MTSEPDTQRAQPQAGAPPWLMIALIGGIVLVAALVTLALTSRNVPQAQSVAPTVALPADHPTTDAMAAPAADAAPPATHGGLNPDGPAVEQIGLAEAKAHFDAGTAAFIDVRAGSEYAGGRIPGALTITSAELESRLAALPAGAVIIAYGDASRPDSGSRGAQIFMELGYPPMIALEGGFQGWRDANYPVEGGL